VTIAICLWSARKLAFSRRIRFIASSIITSDFEFNLKIKINSNFDRFFLFDTETLASNVLNAHATYSQATGCVELKKTCIIWLVLLVRAAKDSCQLARNLPYKTINFCAKLIIVRI